MAYKVLSDICTCIKERKVRTVRKKKEANG